MTTIVIIKSFISFCLLCGIIGTFTIASEDSFLGRIVGFFGGMMIGLGITIVIMIISFLVT